MSDELSNLNDESPWIINFSIDAAAVVIFCYVVVSCYRSLHSSVLRSIWICGRKVGLNEADAVEHFTELVPKYDPLRSVSSTVGTNNLEKRRGWMIFVLFFFARVVTLLPFSQFSQNGAWVAEYAPASWKYPIGADSLTSLASITYTGVLYFLSTTNHLERFRRFANRLLRRRGDDVLYFFGCFLALASSVLAFGVFSAGSVTNLTVVGICISSCLCAGSCAIIEPGLFKIAANGPPIVYEILALGTSFSIIVFPFLMKILENVVNKVDISSARPTFQIKASFGQAEVLDFFFKASRAEFEILPGTENEYRPKETVSPKFLKTMHQSCEQAEGWNKFDSVTVQDPASTFATSVAQLYMMYSVMYVVMPFVLRRIRKAWSKATSQDSAALEQEDGRQDRMSEESAEEQRMWGECGPFIWTTFLCFLLTFLAWPGPMTNMDRGNAGDWGADASEGDWSQTVQLTRNIADLGGKLLLRFLTSRGLVRTVTEMHLHPRTQLLVAFCVVLPLYSVLQVVMLVQMPQKRLVSLLLLSMLAFSVSILTTISSMTPMTYVHKHMRASHDKKLALTTRMNFWTPISIYAAFAMANCSAHFLAKFSTLTDAGENILFLMH